MDFNKKIKSSSKKDDSWKLTVEEVFENCCKLNGD